MLKAYVFRLYPNDKQKQIINQIIGNSRFIYNYYLSDKIKEKGNLHLSFSKMTFPHQLFRVLLLEQIYRVYKINNNEAYHK